MSQSIRQILTVLFVAAGLLSAWGCSDDVTYSRQRPMAVSNSHLEFTSWAGANPYPAQQKVEVTLEGQPTNGWMATTTSDWLRLGPRGTDSIFISVISTDVLAGVHYDSIAVSLTEATNSPIYIEVKLTVLNQVNLSPASMSFATLAGGAQIAAQDLIIANFGTGSVNYTAETTAPWLVLNSLSGTMPDTISVNVDITGLNAGYYLDSIVVNSPELPQTRAVVYCGLSLSSWATVGLGRIDVMLEDVQFVNSQSGWASGWLPNATDPHGFVFRSDNQGDTWSSVYNRSFSVFGGLAAIDASRCFVVGNDAEIFRTNDSGRTWNQIVGLPISAPTVLRDIYFADFAHGWAIGNGGTIISTSDSGATWTKDIVPTAQDLTGIAFLDSQTGWMSGNHGTLLHTGDGGMTWVAQSANTSSDLWAISFVDNLHGWAAGADGLVIHTIDGGATWEAAANAGTSLLLDVVFVSPTQGWVVGIDGAIHRTDDGGVTWVEQTSGTTQSLKEIFFLDDKLGWAVGDAGTVLKTANGGF